MVIVWLPSAAQRQANRTVLLRLRPLLDFFCQIPLRSKVSLPSMKTRACPASQHCSPMVPMIAIARPRNVRRTTPGPLAGRAWLSGMNTALRQYPGSDGEPAGARLGAANNSQMPPFNRPPGHRAPGGGAVKDPAEVSPPGLGGGGAAAA